MKPILARFAEQPALAGGRRSARPRRAVRRLACALALGALAPGVQADDPATAADHRAFLEPLLKDLVEEQQVPGLAAVLVVGDEVVLSAGYGWADLARRQPVDAEHTVFPLGSVSKVLTTMAVLQLADRGAVELDADIRRYLGPVMDERFDAPVTLRHLLTHTDGFDVRWIFGGAARVPEKVLPLDRLLAELPPRVVAPGELYLYGDVGMTVAGRIVERVSGRAFAEYVEHEIFRPLGITTASFRNDYRRNRATGYDTDATGQRVPVAVVYPHAVPASGLTATLADLAPLLRALVRPGGETGVLGRTSVQAMFQRQFAHHPALAGTSFGFYEYVYHGRRALVHGGLLPGFTSVLVILPEARVGLCVAANRFGLIEPIEHQLTRRLLEHFAAAMPSLDDPAAAAPAMTEDVGTAAFTGRYRCDQYSRLSSDKMLVLAGLGDDIEVVAEDERTLRFEPEGTLWRAIGPQLFENANTGDRVFFQRDGSGRASRILGSAQFMSYHRIAFADDAPLHARIGGALALVACLAGVGAAAWRPAGSNQGATRWLLPAIGLAMAAAWVLFVGGLWLSVRGLTFTAAAFGEPPALSWLRLLPLLCAAGAVVQLVLVVRARRHRALPRMALLSLVGGSAASLLLLPLLAQWQLVRLPANVSAFLTGCLSP